MQVLIAKDVQINNIASFYFPAQIHPVACTGQALWHLFFKFQAVSREQLL